jgi:hypothetical protein
MILSGSDATGGLADTVSSDFTNWRALSGEVVHAVDRLGSFDANDNE